MMVVKMKQKNLIDEDENIDWDEPNIPDEGNSSCLKILAIF
jgi:hypothetical protein